MFVASSHERFFNVLLCELRVVVSAARFNPQADVLLLSQNPSFFSDAELFWSICTEAVPNHDTTIDAFGPWEHFRSCGHSTLQEAQTAKVLGTCFWFFAANSGILLSE